MVPNSARQLRRLGAAMLVALIASSCSSSNSDTAGDSTTAKKAKSDESSAANSSLPSAIDANYRSDIYEDPAHWLCNPAGDLGGCSVERDVTAVAPDLATSVERFEPAVDPPVDCFYVYPTVSTDATPNSDLVPDTIERITVAFQFSRFGAVCRQFAPVYRQMTSRGLAALLSGAGGDLPDATLAYRDVLDAWRYYLAHENKGRGVVLVGHSQGSAMLTQLLAQEIEKHPEQSERVVSALLIGWNVNVPKGKDVGGTFTDFPACRESDQLHCVVAYSTFRNTNPPGQDAAFGRPRDPTAAERTDSAALETLCVNPAELLGDKAGAIELHNLFAKNIGFSADPALVPTVSTQFVTLPGLLTGSCVERDGANYLEITLHPDPADPRADQLAIDSQPGWGLHRFDVQIASGDLIDLVKAQSAAWTAAAD